MQDGPQKHDVQLLLCSGPSAPQAAALPDALSTEQSLQDHRRWAFKHRRNWLHYLANLATQ